jgi:hypothetical protein
VALWCIVQQNTEGSVVGADWPDPACLIPAPGARAKAKALNAKKKKNIGTSQLQDEFELVD